MNFLKFGLYGFLMLLTINLKSQSATGETKKVYHYTFEGELPLQNISSLEKSVSQLTYVSTAKVKYKPAGKRGEIIIETLEPSAMREGTIYFDLVELKKLILSYNLNPNELTQQ
ncbi:MAG: hypothetical protein JWO32_3173 [Bacteroidetes bacterium]|nr:hypothetical protein [Bacteroidota bacterium]